MARLALVQFNPTVGALTANSSLIQSWCARAGAAGADIVVFPEMSLTGYPVEDLAQRPSFQAASRQTMDELATHLAADGLGHLHVIVGYLDSLGPSADVGRPRGGPINAAGVIHGGRIHHRYAKHHLPNYGVFDEFRYFVPGSEPVILDVHGTRLCLAICEDLWQDGGPVNWAPYERNKDDVRLALCRRRASESGTTLAYVNLVGGQDELVFDGDSLVVDAAGRVLARAPQFDEHLLLVDLNEPATVTVAPQREDAAEVYAALVLAVRDYVDKNRFRSVILGLSGGIDSALVAAIACDALGPERVHGVSLPSAYSSQHSRDDAADLARRTGLHLRTVPIAPMVDAYLAAMPLTGLAEENLQARVRGTTLMALSNAEGHLVLATGNKSELAVGYSTIYGDAVGGFAPIKDVPKSLVWELARWRNGVGSAYAIAEPIPVNSIEKPPSAELRPGQLDTDSLPDYGVLDRILDAYVEHDRAGVEIAGDLDPDLVERILRMTDAAEYKRRQYPPGPKITGRAFGRDRRQPITSQWREPVEPSAG